MRHHNLSKKQYLSKLLIVLFIIINSAAGASSLEYELIYGESGPSKIKIFIFGEGYADFMRENYKYDVQSIVDTLFSISPYKEYRNLFAVYRVWTPSVWSFIPYQQSDSTFFGGYSGTGGPPKISEKGHQYFRNIILEQNDPNFHCDEFTWNQQSIVLFSGFSSFGNPGVSYLDENLTLMYLDGGGQTAAHELAHQIGRLADEYERATGGTPAYESPNTTQKTTLDSIPWRCWINDTTPVPTPETDDYLDVIGLFEGAQYNPTGWYRPKMHCIMRGTGDLIMRGTGDSPYFCEVCRECLTYKMLMYTHFSSNRIFLSAMVDSEYPLMNSDNPLKNSIVTGGNITVKCARIDTFPIKLSWRFNGSLLQDTGSVLDLSSFRENGTVEAVLVGNSGFIRNPCYIACDTLRWTYQYTNTPVKRFAALSVTDKIKQIRNGVYYIPQSAYGKFLITDMLGRNIPIRAVNKGTDYTIVDLGKYVSRGKYVVKMKEK